jgi:hypothetical protein
MLSASPWVPGTMILMGRWPGQLAAAAGDAAGAADAAAHAGHAFKPKVEPNANPKIWRRESKPRSIMQPVMK